LLEDLAGYRQDRDQDDEGGHDLKVLADDVDLSEVVAEQDHAGAPEQGADRVPEVKTRSGTPTVPIRGLR